MTSPGAAPQSSPPLREITWRAVILGLLLGVVLAAANTYLGLFVGMTVSASIPAAVISMGVLRGVFRNGTILENNIVQTIAASGESLAAGVIFTMPALLIAGVWTQIEYWPTTLVCICGGLLGIGFMIPLRRTHIVEDRELTYPEGVACAEVLKAGDRGGGGALYVLGAMLAGAAMKIGSGGLGLLASSMEWATTLSRWPVYFGADFSPALLGVGYIVRLEVAALVALGGLITWGVAIPLCGTPNDSVELTDWFTATWKNEARFLGVGAMIVGGVWSIFAMRRGIVSGVAEALLGYRNSTAETPRPRTDTDMARSHLAILLLATTALTFGLYYFLIGDVGVTLVACAVMIVMSFLFVAVASYIVGLVGSSNSPVSGMTICAVLLTAGLLLLLGFTGERAIIATLGVAGVVCCAACSAGDISQDLKTGYLIGATPRSQQWMEIVGAAIPAFVMAPVMQVLHETYGIGGDGPNALAAPQATLFASLVQGIFGEADVPWRLVLIGGGVGVGILVLDQILRATGAKFRTPIMPVAVGMYLPFTLAAPMLLGGAVAALCRNRSEARRGVLVSSGLIAGEAIAGVLLALVIAFAGNSLQLSFTQAPSYANFASGAATIAMVLLAGWLWSVDRREETEFDGSTNAP